MEVRIGKSTFAESTHRSATSSRTTEYPPNLNTRIYPNPFMDHLLVDIHSSPAQLEINNISGRNIGNYMFRGTGTIQIDLGQLTKGAYVVRLREEERTISRVMVKD
jgi:hypothetical protein